MSLRPLLLRTLPSSVVRRRCPHKPPSASLRTLPSTLARRCCGGVSRVIVVMLGSGWPLSHPASSEPRREPGLWGLRAPGM